jgi:hypothetical protein
MPRVMDRCHRREETSAGELSDSGVRILLSGDTTSLTMTDGPAGAIAELFIPL